MQDRARDIQAELQKIYAAQAKKADGLGLTKRESELLRKMPILNAELEDMIQNQIRCVENPTAMKARRIT